MFPRRVSRRTRSKAVFSPIVTTPVDCGSPPSCSHGCLAAAEPESLLAPADPGALLGPAAPGCLLQQADASRVLALAFSDSHYETKR